jgi:hypothetical protein
MSHESEWLSAYRRLEDALAIVRTVQPLCENASHDLRCDLRDGAHSLDRVIWSLGRHIRRARECTEIPPRKEDGK